jgi:hypothetical protein
MALLRPPEKPRVDTTWQPSKAIGPPIRLPHATALKLDAVQTEREVLGLLINHVEVGIPMQPMYQIPRNWYETTSPAPVLISRSVEHRPSLTFACGNSGLLERFCSLDN